MKQARALPFVLFALGTFAFSIACAAPESQPVTTSSDTEAALQASGHSSGDEEPRGQESEAQKVVLSGQVRNEAGEPVEKARILLQDIDNREFYDGETSETGEFRFDGVPSSRYLIDIEHDDYAYYRNDRFLNVGAEGLEDFSVQLEEGTELRGRISGLSPDESRGPSFRARRDGEIPRIGWPVGEDRYRVQHLSPGTWEIEAWAERGAHSEWFSVEVPEGAAVVEHDIHFGSGLTLGGKIRRGNEPVVGSSVTLISEESRFSRLLTLGKGNSFRFTRLPAGRYRLSVSMPEATNTLDQVLDLRSDLDLDLDIAPAQLSGRVIGRPGASSRISVHNLGAGPRFREHLGESDGSFEMELPSGRYRLVVFQDGMSLGDRVIEVAPGGVVSGLEIELQPVEPLVLQLDSASGRAPERAELVIQANDGLVLLRRPFEAIADGKLEVPARPAGEGWSLKVFAQGAAAQELPASELRESPVRVELDPQAAVVVRVPNMEAPTALNYGQLVQVRLVDSDGHRFQLPIPNSGIPVMREQWTFQPYLEPLVLDHVPEGQWMLEAERTYRDTTRLPITVQAPRTEVTVELD
ncbi:MAG: carboxypeptidase-like regulatory domain-containing protein [Acidobacteriota bacterium]|nr:carboxypeptidase-like regulatory domain-containing protein [Acidobacteriota bacterium]